MKPYERKPENHSNQIVGYKIRVIPITDFNSTLGMQVQIKKPAWRESKPSKLEIPQ